MSSLMPNQSWQQSHVSTHRLFCSQSVSSDASLCKRFSGFWCEPSELLDVFGEIKYSSFTDLKDDLLRLRRAMALRSQPVDCRLNGFENCRGLQQRVKGGLHFLLDDGQVFIEIAIVDVDGFTPCPLIEQVCL